MFLVHPTNSASAILSKTNKKHCLKTVRVHCIKSQASLVVALLRAQATQPITWLKNTTGNEHQGKRTLLVRKFLFLFDQR